MHIRSHKKTYGIFETGWNRKLIGELKSKAANVILFPEITVDGVSVDAESGSVVRELKKFDWIVFTDIYTVDRFVETLYETRIDIFELDEVRVCACGEAVADRLRFGQIHADVIPSNTRHDTIVNTIKSYLSGHEVQETINLLLIRGDEVPDLVKLLKEENWHVRELCLYTVKPENDGQMSKLKPLFLGGAIDEFIFGSPEDVFNFKRIFSGHDYFEIFAEVEAVAVDGVVFQSLREIGITPRLHT